MSTDGGLTERMYETSSGSASTMRSRACLAMALQLFVICEASQRLGLAQDTQLTHNHRMDLTAHTGVVAGQVSRRSLLRRDVFGQERTQCVCLTLHNVE